jgi:hypothetical protein
VIDRIVAWTGGNSVIVFNPDTKSCTTVTANNGPGAAQPNGTFGRWRYFPGLDAFVVIDDAGAPGFAFRF